MKRKEFKEVTTRFVKKLVDGWFNDKPFIKGLGYSIIEANKNKMDSFIELFEDENGDIDVYGIINNIGSINEPIKIDLMQISPLLPNRILLITKDDFQDFLRYVNTEENR